jgi:cytochrome P450
MPHAIDLDKAGAFTVADLTRPAVIGNPYPYYAQLRPQAPQFGLVDFPPGTVPGQDTPQKAWAFLKYDDVVAVARNHKAFSSRDPMQEASDAPTLMLVNHDRPRHTELRAIAQQAFKPRRVEDDTAPYVAEKAARLLDALPAGDVDIMDHIAPALPALVMTRLIGTPEEDHGRLRRWANAFMLSSDFTLEERGQCNAEIAAYYQDAVAERYGSIAKGVAPPDDLMTAFIQAEHEGNKLTPEEVVRFCITLVVAGAETTTYLLGNLIGALATAPGLFDQIRADRSLAPSFIEESLRRDGPPQRLFRIATRDIEVGGAAVREGDWVAVFYAAANRDPTVFEDPDAFILDRPNVNRHLTFGHGIHFCMGAGIARMEAKKLINALLDRFTGMEPGEEPMVRQSGGLLNYGYDTCPVRFLA